jgi:polyferredoxin
LRRLRLLRVVVAALVLCGFTLSFADFTGVLAVRLGWLARIQFMPAVLSLSLWTFAAILGLTFLFGRVYCSMICPLGILQDVFFFLGRLFGVRRNAAPPQGRSPAVFNVVRGALAFVFFGGGFLGLHFQWLEPYAIYSRLASVVVSPLARMGNNVLAEWAARSSSSAFHAVECAAPAMAVVVASMGVAALVASLAVWRGRAWCNTMCPVGTVLAGAARLALVKPVIDGTSCVKCGMCARVCRGRCIDVEKGRIDLTRCVACFDCGAVCGKGAISWSK